MGRHGVVRQACLITAVLLVLISVASANNIEIKFDPGEAGANGTIDFIFFTDGNGISLASTSVKVRKGYTGDDIARVLSASLNANPFVSYAYTASYGTEDIISCCPISVMTVPTVTITPNAGIGADFTFGGSYVPPTSDPKLPGGGIKVISPAPGTATLNLVVNGPSISDLFVNWELYVVNQNGTVNGFVILPGVPDSTSAAALIALFDSSLLNQGIPVAANGNTLSLTTSDNDFFYLTRSAAGSLDYRISDASPVPEPGTMALLGGSLLGLAGTVRRKLR